MVVVVVVGALTGLSLVMCCVGVCHQPSNTHRQVAASSASALHDSEVESAYASAITDIDSMMRGSGASDMPVLMSADFGARMLDNDTTDISPLFSDAVQLAVPASSSSSSTSAPPAHTYLYTPASFDFVSGLSAAQELSPNPAHPIHAPPTEVPVPLQDIAQIAVTRKRQIKPAVADDGSGVPGPATPAAAAAAKRARRAAPQTFDIGQQDLTQLLAAELLCDGSSDQTTQLLQRKAATFKSTMTALQRQCKLLESSLLSDDARNLMDRVRAVLDILTTASVFVNAINAKTISMHTCIDAWPLFLSPLSTTS